MATHKVKSWCYLFEQVVSGQKLHEIRKVADRNYQIGDTLILQEYDQTKGTYTGREQPVEITYITSNQTPCALSGGALAQEYCILSIKKT